VIAAQIASMEDDAAALAGVPWLMTRLSMMAQPYVPTPPLHTAVKGRETELLDAVGITWQDGAPHIRCPYAAHSDHHPSWRWDRAKARAYCTCIERGWHSIFDVVMQVESLDFEAAKLRIAQILGRTDLIKGGDRDRAQAMDAASLLRPPADERNETLSFDFDPVDELTIFAYGDWEQAGLYHALSEAAAALAEDLELGNLDEPL
jgi:hypothetical protein